jgi:hypothetical protein
MADTQLAENPRAVIGSNAPPPSPYDIAKKAVEDAYDETILWLDGKPIDSQETADGVGNLLAVIRKAETLADDTRKAEAKVFDDGKAEVQAKYAPLIGNTTKIKGKTVLAAEACKAALRPWLAAEQKRLDAEAAAKRAEADRQRIEAESALRASAADLAAREAAETLLHDARKAETAANVAGRATAIAGGTFGRSAALRTVWRATITDDAAAAKSCWLDDAGREEMKVFLLDWANRRVRQGVRSIPGFHIGEDHNVA